MMPSKSVAAFEQQRLRLLGQLFERLVDLDAQARGAIAELLLHVGRTGAGAEPAIEQGLGRIDDDLRGIEAPGAAEPVAGFARAERAVEGERSRLELRDAGAAIRDRPAFANTASLRR